MIDENNNDGLYEYIAEDVIGLIHWYCDIPSLYSLSVTCHDGYNLTMGDDLIWRRLVNCRFGFNRDTHKIRNISTMLSWRERYRQWNICQRPPKSLFRQPNRMMVVETKKNNSKSARRRNSHDNSHGVAMWVTLGHTDNCQTKRMSHGYEEQQRNRRNNCIELKIGLQLVKSSSVPVQVDFRQVQICMLDEKSNPYLVPVISSINNTNQDCPNSTKLYENNYHNLMVHSKYQPKLLQTSTGNHHRQFKSIELKPFDFVVASVHVPTYVLFETDFLARAAYIQIPVKYNHDSPIKMVKCNFISETNIWKYYQELPGGCLSLITCSHTFTP